MTVFHPPDLKLWPVTLTFSSRLVLDEDERYGLRNIWIKCHLVHCQDRQTDRQTDTRTQTPDRLLYLDR